tara:strand:- start:114 stop:833 length:720 start_codon:yes stop_codon:yes gene_type:complete
MKKTFNFSPNFSKRIRSINLIKFVVIHYTGMQSEIASIKRLKSKKSKVSCHYLINKKGEVFQMVPENKIAWHAGKSKWKNFKNLNRNSIGIELTNKGHKLGYENFSKLQIQSLVTLCKELKRKYKIPTSNFLGHSDIAPLRKLDPGEKFPWQKLSFYKIGLWYKIKVFKVKNNINCKFKNLFFKNIYKIGYRYFQIYKRRNQDRKIIRVFQQRYLPKNVTGIIDKKTYEISAYLANKFA